MVFPVVIYRYESWTVKKAECWRMDAFELWCWRRLLRVPWTARRSNQSILKEISPGISLEGMMLKLKLQYFGHLMQRVYSLEKALMLGGIGGRRRRGWQRMRWLDAISDSMDVSLSEVRELVMNREAWRAAIYGFAKSGTWLSDWSDLNVTMSSNISTRLINHHHRRMREEEELCKIDKRARRNDLELYVASERFGFSGTHWTVFNRGITWLNICYFGKGMLIYTH